MVVGAKVMAIACAAGALSVAQPLLSGPYNVEVIPAGDEIVEPLTQPALTALADGNGSWTLSAWIDPTDLSEPSEPLMAIRAADGRDLLSLSVSDQGLLVRSGGLQVESRTVLRPHTWSAIAMTEDAGRLSLYVNGTLRAATTGAQALAGAAAIVIAPGDDGGSFSGRVAALRLTSGIDALALRRSAASAPDASLVAFTPNSPDWPTQTKQQLGQVTPQPADTLPVSRGGFSAARAMPIPSGPALVAQTPGRWTIHGWRLAAAPGVAGDGASLSQPGHPTGTWYAATVPGTVLTTLVDRGVYPDPSFGLNNMAIPESLSRQSYWYRTQFSVPNGAAGRHVFLNFKGINYAAEIWVNGAHIGDMKGAFIRGRFDVTDKVRPGSIATVAVKVAPPPHPGIAEEESLKAGAGENGGMLVLDGPTFVASEGWDWIPSIRDRETGLWQGVELEEAGDIRIGDTQVVTTLPLPDNSVADVAITVPVDNLSDHAVATLVRARFDTVDVEQTVTLAPREHRDVVFDPDRFPQLAVRHPLLWWPNGYGAANLHDMTMSATVGGVLSDSRRLRFGMREVSYEMSLVDEDGRLRRLLVDPSRARGTQIVDATHDHIRKVRGGWAPSLAAGAVSSPAIQNIADTDTLSPYLVIRVNGVRIAARGGNWGMDDLMKRIGRDRLEPYFRLHRDAHLNIIRNWVGQNTEETFYDLADEYGLMVLNDFWESTQNYNQQADDTALFMANAHDVVDRFRNHPSIIAWIGRNEGVPQPTLNGALQQLITTNDGTRLYLPASNHINLAGSGPYDWRDPQGYFTHFAPGFAVEVGTPSFPTLESWKRTMPKADLWPISDTWAYHDWHQDRGGAVGSYMDAMKTRFGAPTGLNDFAAKAQMLQYDSYRAIFEGFNAGLWKQTSGRMLWMTQPAWPSSAWNTYSSDYDAQASYYAVKAASEPIHVQMNLPDHAVALVNNTQQRLQGIVVRYTVEDLDGRVLAQRATTIDAPAASVTPAGMVDDAVLSAVPVALIRLDAIAANGELLSRNTYWQGRQPSDLKAMTTMKRAALNVSALRTASGEEDETEIMVDNPGRTPAIETKFTLFDHGGKQILPAYFSDNYVTLLPGEHRTITVRYPAGAADAPVHVAVRGWNVNVANVVEDRRAPRGN